jgi:hypothetical protein
VCRRLRQKLVFRVRCCVIRPWLGGADGQGRHSGPLLVVPGVNCGSLVNIIKQNMQLLNNSHFYSPNVADSFKFEYVPSGAIRHVLSDRSAPAPACTQRRALIGSSFAMK